MHENLCLWQLDFNIYVQKFSASGQVFIKIPKTVLELLKKIFLGGDVQQHKKPSWNYQIHRNLNIVLSQMFLIFLVWKFEKSKDILRIPCRITWFNQMWSKLWPVTIVWDTVIFFYLVYLFILNWRLDLNFHLFLKFF